MDATSQGQSFAQLDTGPKRVPGFNPMAGENAPNPGPRRPDGAGLPPGPTPDQSITTATETPSHKPDPATVRADITVRASAAFTNWVATVAAEERVSMAVLIELVLVEWAESRKFERPPARFPTKPTARRG